MQLAVRQEDANVLLNEKNTLNVAVVDKYRVAGQVAQTTLAYVVQLITDSYHLGKTERPYSVQELCILGDSMASKMLATVFKDSDKVREKGLALPVTINVNERVANSSPEIDTPAQYLAAGDVATVSVGAHIDGYTALVSHTVVIYPPGVNVDGELKPEGPLLGAKADAVVASYVACEAVVALLAASLTPEKLAAILLPATGVTGALIRSVVDSVAASFGCAVLPGSKVRRVRRFLAGQAEGVVAERDFKGVVWGEADQEAVLLRQGAAGDLVLHSNPKNDSSAAASAIPSDDFVVGAGEVYHVDIAMCSTADFAEKGLITLQDEDVKPTIFVRDVAVTHQLRLKGARRLLGLVDHNFSVYPFKLSYTCDSFPVDFESGNAAAQLDAIRSETRVHRLGLNELTNRYLARPKGVQIAKHVPLAKILTSSNPAGSRGIDAAKLSLPGREVPLPELGVSALKLKSLLKFGAVAPAVAREATTVLLNDSTAEALRLTGGALAVRPSWVHSRYQLQGEYVAAVQGLSQLVQDAQFGIKIKEVQPLQLNSAVMHLDEKMQLD